MEANGSVLEIAAAKGETGTAGCDSTAQDDQHATRPAAVFGTPIGQQSESASSPEVQGDVQMLLAQLEADMAEAQKLLINFAQLSEQCMELSAKHVNLCEKFECDLASHEKAAEKAKWVIEHQWEVAKSVTEPCDTGVLASTEADVKRPQPADLMVID